MLLASLSEPPPTIRLMGVLYDYFRAADDAAAKRLMDELDGGPVVRGDMVVDVDAVDLKGIDPAVILAQLVAFIRQTEWAVDTVEDQLLWSGDEQGPWLSSIDDAARDTLASISDDQFLSLSQRWSRIEELWLGEDVAGDEMVPVIEEIAGLARRARDAGEHLYCWSCL